MLTRIAEIKKTDDVSVDKRQVGTGYPIHCHQGSSMVQPLPEEFEDILLPYGLVTSFLGICPREMGIHDASTKN